MRHLVMGRRKGCPRGIRGAERHRRRGRGRRWSRRWSHGDVLRRLRDGRGASARGDGHRGLTRLGRWMFGHMLLRHRLLNLFLDLPDLGREQRELVVHDHCPLSRGYASNAVRSRVGKLLVYLYKQGRPTVGIGIADPVWRGKSFSRQILAQRAKDYLLFFSFVLSKRPPAGVIASRAKLTTRSETTACPLAYRRQRCPRAPRSSRSIRSVRARPLSSPESLYSPRQTPLGIWEDASARVARITASIPRVQPTRRREEVAPALLTSLANIPSPRAPSSSLRSARFPGGR